MSTATEAVTGGKLPPLTVQSLRVGNVTQYAVTAVGADQATALAVTTGASRVVVSTAAASTGVRLPASRFKGDQIFIANHGANTITAYPATGDQINDLAANAGVTIPAATSRWFLCVLDADTTWVG